MKHISDAKCRDISILGETLLRIATESNISILGETLLRIATESNISILGETLLRIATESNISILGEKLLRIVMTLRNTKTLANYSILVVKK